MTPLEVAVDLARKGNRLFGIEDTLLMDIPVYDASIRQNIMVKILIDLNKDGPAITVGKYENGGFRWYPS